MDIFLSLLTYFAYAFIIVSYGLKVVKYIRMPIHLRWELSTSTVAARSSCREGFPGASEQQASQSNRRQSSKIWSFVREYLWFPSYLSHNKAYWIFLYIAHIGFVGLIIFQFICIATAAGSFMVDDQPFDAVDKATGSLVVLRITLGIISFAAGIIGNIGLMLYRISHKGLRLYTPPLTFIGYCISIGISIIGFILLLAVDPRFSGYVTFFVGTILLQQTGASGWLGLFILLNAFHLIYLPFTPGFHYITRAFALFGVQWDTRPNIKGSAIEKAIGHIMKNRITWSADHIKKGQAWEETAKDRS